MSLAGESWHCIRKQAATIREREHLEPSRRLLLLDCRKIRVASIPMAAVYLARRRETPLLPVLVWTRLINVGTLVRVGRARAVYLFSNDYDASSCIPDQFTIEDNPDIQD